MKFEREYRQSDIRRNGRSGLYVLGSCFPKKTSPVKSDSPKSTKRAKLIEVELYLLIHKSVELQNDQLHCRSLR